MVLGRVKQIAPKTYSWELGTKTYENGWCSHEFLIPEYSDKCYFYLHQRNQNPLSQTGSLYLFQFGLLNDTPVIYDLHIVSRYQCETKELQVIRKGIRKRRKWKKCYLDEINTCNLLEITFTFLDRELPSGTTHIPDAPCISKKLEESAGGLDKECQNKQKYKLKKEKGFATLCEDLKNAFLSQEDSDVILRVGDQLFPAHKVIIRNRSSVFRAMLEHDMSEKNEGFINIEDCDPDIFRYFLLYLYSGEIEDISNENVFQLYYMSDKYDVKQLKLDCTDYLMNNLSIDIICDVIALAAKHLESDLLKHATNYFTENAESIFLTVHWPEFMKENPVEANELILKAFKSDSRKQNSGGEKHK